MPSWTYKINLKHTKPDPANKFGVIQLPTTEEVIEMTIDLDRIADELGPRACRNKCGESILLNGLVIIRHRREN